MGKREAFAIVAIPLLVAAIGWLPPVVFLGLLSVAVALAADDAHDEQQETACGEG